METISEIKNDTNLDQRGKNKEIKQTTESLYQVLEEENKGRYEGVPTIKIKQDDNGYLRVFGDNGEIAFENLPTEIQSFIQEKLKA